MDLKEKIRHILHRKIKETKIPVEIVYLYGSYAKGKPSDKSDIDIAILYDEVFYSREPLRAITYAELIALEIEKNIHKLVAKVTGEVDIKILNRSSPFFSYVVSSTGIPVYFKSKKVLYSYYCKSIGMYLDFKLFMKKAVYVGD